MWRCGHVAHVIQVGLKAGLFSCTINEDNKPYLALVNGKLLLVTNANARPRRWCSTTRV